MFRGLCRSAWNKPYSFLNIDRTLPECDGKYGRCFEEKYRVVLNRNAGEGEVWRKKCCGTEEERRKTQEVGARNAPWKHKSEADRLAKNQSGLSRLV